MVITSEFYHNLGHAPHPSDVAARNAEHISGRTTISVYPSVCNARTPCPNDSNGVYLWHGSYLDHLDMVLDPGSRIPTFEVIMVIKY